MAYTYFNKDEVFYNDVEELINGYINLYEIGEAYPINKVIRALKRAYDIQDEAYKDDSGWNKIAILSAKHCVVQTIEEVEERFPIEEYPELWI